MIHPEDKDFPVEDNRAIERLVEKRWPIASREERKSLVDLMILFESDIWGEYCVLAEQNSLPDNDLLLDRKDEVMESYCNGIANNDGTTVAIRSIDHYREQVKGLQQYVNDFLLSE